MFRERSHKKELLDIPDIPKEDLFLNLKELDTINRLLGGYNVVLSGIKELISNNPKSQIRILDIGSGGGDTLKQIHKKFKNKYAITLTGVDLKEDCIDYSISNCKGSDVGFIKSDYRDLLSENLNYDIITASLFCHHLSDDEIVSLLMWMKSNAKIGVVINDIHRHYLAYYSIKLLTSLFSSSYLVKNDAPLSVLRAFTKNELISLFERAEISNYTITWHWAFRWRVCIKTTSK